MWTEKPGHLWKKVTTASLTFLSVMLGLATTAWAQVEAPAGAAKPTPPATTGPTDIWSQIDAWLSTGAGQIGLKIAIALLILIVGWVLAKLLSWGIYKLLCSTTWDDKIAEKLGLNMLLSKQAQKRNTLERSIATIAYYILMMLVIVGALEYTGLTQVASPFEGLINSIFQAIPNIGKAALILIVAYFGGLILRTVVTKTTNKAKLDERFAELADVKDENAKPFGESIGAVVFWLIMAFGLAGALDALKIDALSGPVSNAIDTLVAALPFVAKAALIVLAGYALGRIAKTIVSNLLNSVGLDKAATKLKLEKVFEKRKASEVIGLVVFFFILLEVVIAALDELGLQTLSEPLSAMMGQFWTMLPSLAVAAFVVVLGVVVSRVVRSVVESVLKSVGFDDFMHKMGFDKLANRSEKLDEPSELLGLLVQIAIILLASAQALETIGLATWAAYLDTFLGYVVKNVTVAIIITLVGFAVGNYVRDLIIGEGKDETRRWMAMIARYTVLVLALTMAVHQLDVAQTFVLILFGLLFGALCLAMALAFGLGSRGVAEEIVTRQYKRAMSSAGSEGETKSTK